MNLLEKLPPALLAKLTAEQKRQLANLTATGRELQQALDIRKHNKRETIFADHGRFHRGLYPKHVAFFDAGARHKARLFMAANRVGKTESGAYEATCHATGIYPHWWKGRRFPGPTEGWACGTTAETCRDIVQKALLGGVSEMGSGMIPRHLILDVKPRPHGLKDAKEQILVRHASGGVSVIGLKSYEQGRKSFEGTAKHWIWDDEEPPSDVYSEQTMRTATVRGILWLTFTPLQGMSEVVKGFVEPEKGKEKWYVQAGWKDAPHIPEDEKEELIRTTLPHELKARTEGEPSLGIGAIYPIAEDRIVCKEMVIPDSWPRSYGMDVGWNWTAVVWGARNPSTNTTYMYADYLGEQEAPAVHAAAVRAKGEWIEGAIDPAANGRSQVDGQKLMDIYRRLGLKLIKADNAVSSGLKVCWEGLVDGTIKVMPSCENWLREFRKYHRDTKGAIVKANDHLMDAWRYRMVSGRAIERVMLTRITAPPTEAGGGERGWMA